MITFFRCAHEFMQVQLRMFVAGSHRLPSAQICIRVLPCHRHERGVLLGGIRIDATSHFLQGQLDVFATSSQRVHRAH